MAQIIPSITSLPIDSSAAPSVEDIQDRLPTICVDYLSHHWQEEDVWASWRSMTRHKHEIANGVRLENASWRTWQKQRNKLKTISPETLNWLKDSDVTWLYGPLHTANVEPVAPLRVATTDERLGIDLPNPSLLRKASPTAGGTKPILKHRTLSEMLTIPMPSSPVLESSNYNDDDIDSNDGDNDRPLLLQTKSDTNIIRNRSNPTRRKSPPRGPISGGKNTPADGTVSPPIAQESTSGKRHISFNTFVEQCVAIDDPSAVPTIQESDDEDEMLEMRSSHSSSSRSSRPSMSRNSSSGSVDHLTIAKIAPTLLKTMNAPGGTSAMVYQPPPEYISPGLKSPNQQFDFPSPMVEQHSERWAEHDEDEDYGSYDYFGGPNLGGDDESRAAPATSPQAASSYSRPPTVNQPPSQPKWRQAPAQPPAVEPSSVSSSNSSSSYNITSPPQPSRSILKVRPPSAAVPAEPSSPPTAYFNYNPSAATGIGGMRGSTGGVDVPGPTGSPLVSPVVATAAPAAEERGRGRTASRDRLNDRSTSRGTSSSSTTSVHSNTSRSPVDSVPTNPSRKVQSQPQLDKVQEGVTWAIDSQLQQQQDAAQSQDYVPERSSTPTPHSSPQITFRPLKDTSPASLPHISSPNTTNSSSRTSDLPKADPPTAVSPTLPNKNNTSSAKATIAHVGTNAQPTLFQPQGADDGDVYDGDNGTIIGRAANIANSAKDLLGALWYGEGKEQGVRQGQGQGQGSQGQKRGGHKRGTSLG